MTPEDIKKAIADVVPFIGSGAYDGPSDEALNTLVEFANEYMGILRPESVTYDGVVLNDIPEVPKKFDRLVLIGFELREAKIGPKKDYLKVDPDIFKVDDNVKIVVYKVEKEEEDGTD